MAAPAPRIVQYVVLRADLRAPAWTRGALVAQACHACLAAVHLSREQADTQRYLEQLDSMATVVLQAPDEESLVKLSQRLTEEQVDHKLWVEQPENCPTCLALRPCPKEQVQGLMKNLKLLK
ncbi:putative peptidyl-tRNA hydrolase PTRHD1 [Amblyraja radiata]|uniref:putative peptidyl-tRNA hydrolase PTRHD1 n=1 Tax=Amblyraja radiata TaxID=386614 RepID=UPI0014040BDA|nr:putative peptidyl-tRNA hydrolase PTRHD1 [Amblyraja radiata]XP_032880974.1 putative peptidyl-tRNA hydrolase PTRHD1 [Amblyraja radiata]XP_055486962.1 putative peptidyl-tRNA hydrolase PTRHD1 [Leucoraja erinacea]